MFIYVTDTNGTLWAINSRKIIKITESGKTTLIYFVTGDILKVSMPIAEMTQRLNNV